MVKLCNSVSCNSSLLALLDLLSSEFLISKVLILIKVISGDL